MNLPCRRYKGTTPAPWALFSVHLTSSLEDWGQGKFTCHPRRNIIYKSLIDKNFFDHIKAFDNKNWDDHFKIKETEIYRQ